MTIAGSDSCGGAGIQADIKTISALGGYACCAITAITCQNTQGVGEVEGISPRIVRSQIETVMRDMTIDAFKSGMLYSKDIINETADVLAKKGNAFYVLDPVMISTSGHKLIEGNAIETMVEKLFPISTIVTPNIPETEYLTGIKLKDEDDTQIAAEKIMELGCEAVLIKGGHSLGDVNIDTLFMRGHEPVKIYAEKIPTRNTHGTGCTLASAIATELAKNKNLEDACKAAHDYLHNAILEGKDTAQGKGHGPVCHFWSPEKQIKIG